MLTPIQKIMASLAILVFAGQAHALTFAESAHNKNQSTLYGNVGFYGGEIALGVEYETEIEKSHSAGGFFRYFGGNPSAIALAGYIRIHTFKRAWDFYVSPGFGLLNGSSETVLGP
ncbi:MAG: hypothetical protein KDD50_15620, partial [Bdellovibrionales bacterium]|nr:hypothetical protein [Bdellovibrionales bacterium]